MKRSHNSVLNKIIDFEEDSKFKNKLLEFNWIIHVEESANYILGDTGPIIRNKNNSFSSFINNEDDYLEIYLPISYKHVIIGYKTNKINLLTSNDLNIQIASVSKEYFISKYKNNEIESLINMIGKNASYFNIKDIL